MAKIDYLVYEARRQKVLTIGIGDGGNEIGMGVIKETIKKYVPFGDRCQCPCGAGIAPTTETDVTIASAVSNWGAYGIEACLSFLLKDPKIIHDENVEQRVLRESADAGLIDGGTGYAEPGADGLGVDVHCSIVRILREIVEKQLLPPSWARK